MKSIFLKSKLIVWLGIVVEKIRESTYIVKHMGTGWVSNDAKKLLPRIQIGCHALEKGMSIGKVRKGFGKDKFNSLLNMMSRYLELGGENKAYIAECCSVLSRYLEFNTELGADMSDLLNVLKSFCLENGVELPNKGGIIEKKHSEEKLLIKENFGLFAKSRSSIRDYGDEKLSEDAVFLALKLAETTPSACNRQGWKVHVYFNEELRNKLFQLQGGCKGFYEDMQCAILICGNTHSYSFQEQGVLFVDGGLYAMNLLYSLHYYGLAAIPLTMGMKMSRIKSFQRNMNIPHNEIPVLIIGVGTYKESYRVAKSERFPYQQYCKIIP